MGKNQFVRGYLSYVPIAVCALYLVASPAKLVAAHSQWKVQNRHRQTKLYESSKSPAARSVIADLRGGSQPRHSSADVREINSTLDFTNPSLIEEGPHLNALDSQSEADRLRNLDLNTSAALPIPAWREHLPPPLRLKKNTLQRVRIKNVEIFLLGTAHVSSDSSEEVKLLLRHVHPDAIFVELCEARIPLLEGTAKDEHEEEALAHQNRTMREKIRQVQSTQGGSRLQALSTVLLTSVQEDYASELGVELGGEFRAAYQYWQAQQSIPTGTSSQSCALILGDRPLQLTLVRAWESLGFWPKVKVLLGLLWSSWQKPKKEEIQEWLQSVLRDETDVLTESLKELRRHFPTLFTVIIAERDAWLAAKLVQSCRVLSASATAASPVCTVVAIVGAGHIPGIVAWLTTPPADTSITPETVLRDLVTTKRWAHDDAIQLQAIPAWIYEVSHLQPSAS
ncbi:predicted protein [Phaeodactylum tricornutum CCAP 1055/1]|uniref:Uncharacterized protein n=2 Tax=Phaeodactylum tricornutum TaxID=2850 RepID=B7GCI9_PHATC|nr:predicted protein [Phaeodactylum tricornutum CCAP 1055/1]EEC43617.1 predicted protein [Phaeodactylum tricornutum CCAP 1055/1]|eukprot:XP_002184881.1 predicted protein [Phaeodactylum tricornutum CCAP 1055/1]